MRKLIFSSFMLLSALSFAQTRLVDKVERKGNELVIPYEKYLLSNGLTLIIHEDHSDPIVHTDVTYHVGSAREEIGKSGFAHFFEHMMFQGSDHVGDEQHFKIVSEAGGTLNGTTNQDRTNYFETMPSNQLEVAMWLESDRMGFLLDAVTQQKFEVQRSTVKNERGQNYDNRPYGLAREKTAQALFPYGHPYSWLTIGYIEDLNRSNVEDLKKFFLRWYGPNNATLTIAGDVKPAEVVKLAEIYFGSIPRCPEVKPMAKLPVTIDADRYISYEDNIRFPMVSLSFPTVASYSADEAPLDILADIIGGGKNSILYKNFIKTELAVSADAMHPTSELAGDFELSVRAMPDKSLTDMEAMLRTSLAEFEARGVTDDDLQRFKAGHEADLINSISTVNGKASSLASYQTFTGNPNQIGNELNRYLRVTKADVMRVYNTYIKGKPAVILSVYPKGKPEQVAKPNNFTPLTTGTAMNVTDYSGLVYKKAHDSFDRNNKPVAGPAPLVKVPAYWSSTFSNGMKVIGANTNEIPTYSILLSIEAGHKVEPVSKAGLAYLTAALMNESTEKYTAEELADRTEKLGSDVSVSASGDYLSVSVSGLVKNVDAALELMQERLFHPRFDATEFERLKKQQLETIANQRTSATVMASNVFNKLLYGGAHILSMPVIGTAESVKNLTLEDVKAFYKERLSPSVSSLVIVGDVEQETVLSKLRFLSDWPAQKVSIPVLGEAPAISKTTIYLVDKDRAPQSEFRIGYMSIPYDATGEYFKTGLMNFCLGGAFNSRINLNLREDKGWTYGARSSFNGDKLKGPFVASAGIRGDVTDSATVEFMKEIKNYADKGMTAAELEFTRKSIGQRDALRYESNGQKGLFLRQIVTYGLDKDFVSQQTKLLNAITLEELDAIAKKQLPYNAMNIVIVGDKKKVRAGLAKLGYPLVDMDSDGNVVVPTEAK